MDSELLIIRYHPNNSFDKTVTFVNFNKDVAEENLLKTVSQSNGAIVNKITYQPMVPSDSNSGYGVGSDLYSSSNSLDYPNLAMRQSPSNKLVSKLENTSLNITKSQDFRHSGYSINLNGVGALGFAGFARSAWYTLQSKSKTWSVQQNSALLRGANVSNKTIVLPQNVVFDFNANYPSSYIVASAAYNYTQTTDPVSKRYSILLDKETNTDYLTKIVTEKNNEIFSTDFFLPMRV